MIMTIMTIMTIRSFSRSVRLVSFAVLAALVCVMVPFDAAAGEAEVELTGGMLYVQRANHEWVHGDPVITSLDDEAAGSSISIPVLMVEVSYSPGAGGTEFYADSPMSEDSMVGFGVRADAGPAQVDVFVYATLGMQVWKDPYLVGLPRQETWATEYGASLGLSEVGGLPLAFEYGVEFLTVSQDLAGAAYPELDRDGMRHWVELGWLQEFSSGFSVKPVLVLESGNYDGGAMSFSGSGAALELAYEGGKLSVESRFEFIARSYDEVHPLFGLAREDDLSSAHVMVTGRGMFASDRLSMKAGLLWESRSSNITFFDARGDLVFVGVGYSL